MKRTLLTLGLLCIAVLPASGQLGNTVTLTGSGAPVGNCAFVQYYINSATGDFYNCFGGAWHLLTSGGSGTHQWSCQSGGLGDGLNAVPAGTYLQSNCYNDTASTITLTGFKCYTDGGSSTMNATNSTGTGLLTGAITCSTSYASGVQSATTTLAPGDFIKFTFVADGTSKQTSWVVSGQF